MKNIIFNEKLEKDFGILPKSKTECDIIFYELDHIDGEDFYYKAFYLRGKNCSGKNGVKILKEDIEKDFSRYLNEAKVSDIEIIDEVNLEAEVREKRNRLLQESDYILMPDYPISDSQFVLWKAYRQALRDIPEQEGFPTSIVWPIKP